MVYSEVDNMSALLWQRVIGGDFWDIFCTTYLQLKHPDSCTYIPRRTVKSKEGIAPRPLSREEYGKMLLRNTGRFTLQWLCLGPEARALFKAQQRRVDKIGPREQAEITKKSRESPGIKCQLLGPYALNYRLDIYMHAIKKECRRSQRLIVMPLALAAPNQAHANMLIYDRKFNTLERFDPHGTTSPDFAQTKGLDAALRNLASMIDLKARYLPPSSICPNIGPQTLEAFAGKRYPELKKIGSCSLWTLLYADLRLSYPEMSSRDIAMFLSFGAHKGYKSIRHYIISIVAILGPLAVKLKNVRSIREAKKLILSTSLYAASVKSPTPFSPPHTIPGSSRAISLTFDGGSRRRGSGSRKKIN